MGMTLVEQLELRRTTNKTHRAAVEEGVVNLWLAAKIPGVVKSDLNYKAVLTDRSPWEYGLCFGRFWKIYYVITEFDSYGLVANALFVPFDFMIINEVKK